MEKITFVHGGAEYDSKYPDGIPTRVQIFLKNGNIIKKDKEIDSGMVMYPGGHARNQTIDLN